MNKSNDYDHDNLLDRAARALADTAVPDGPPESLVETLLSTVNTEDNNQQKPSNISRRAFTMKSIARMTVAVSFMLAVGLGLFWILSQSGPKLAFADVADTFLGIRTATCNVSVNVDGPSAKNDPMLSTLKGMKGKALFMAPSHQRMEMEMSFPGGGKKKIKMVQVMDMGLGKMLQLIPSKKMGIVVTLENMTKEKKTSSNYFLDVREYVANARKINAKVESLGEKQIEGKAVVGFSVEQVEGMGNVEFWADSKTGMPVKVELHYDSGVIAKNSFSMVMSDFQTGMNLDESLFDIEVPEGYQIQKATMDASESTIVDLSNMLRLLAKQNNDMFPDKLPGSKDLARLMKETAKYLAEEGVEKSAKQKTDKMNLGEMQEMMKKVAPIGRGVQFVAMLKADNDWHYAGKGVKLDTPDVPIFWYKPTDSEKYKVLYADLTIKEMVKSELPKPKSP